MVIALNLQTEQPKGFKSNTYNSDLDYYENRHQKRKIERRERRERREKHLRTNQPTTMELRPTGLMTMELRPPELRRRCLGCRS
ncbi:hypothetical protein PanWU01x14_263940 [Parasponia andersonii]|uniref:Uncharacterized protein n=1 Tax=Parasponia andersonii TaxID=3476 RepID=A0A2P5B7N8_PARAD|nr:hypothetical protein PanWU01x14_263940 [Parasponia andersonii]